jgi:hypothetical protein
MGALYKHVSTTLSNDTLNGVRGANKPVGDGVVDGLVVVGDTADDDGTDGPEHLQHLRGRGSQSHGHDFGTVGRGVGDENTPRDTLKNLGCEEHAAGGGKVEHQDEKVEAHESANGCPSVSDPAGNGTGDEDTNQGTDGTRTLERRLPRSLDNVSAGVGSGGHTEILGEPLGGDELSHQEDTVRLHNLSPG